MAGISSKAAGKLTNKNKFLGKELQSAEFGDGTGLEWTDYGARMYDNQIGRFLVQDRYLEKSNESNPYHYCQNNPINAIDKNGDEVIILSLQGEGVVKDFLSMIQEGLGNFYKVNQNEKNGSISLEATGKKGKMSKEQKAFYDILTNLIKDPKEFTTYVVEGNSQTEIGGWGGIGPGNIDVMDLKAFPVEGVVTQRGNIAHELFENAERVKKGDGSYKTGYLPAHKKAIKEAENPANGSIRNDKLLPSSNYSFDSKHRLNGNQDQYFTKDGIKYIVTENWINGNVNSVTITPAPKK